MTKKGHKASEGRKAHAKLKREKARFMEALLKDPESITPAERERWTPECMKYQPDDEFTMPGEIPMYQQPDLAGLSFSERLAAPFIKPQWLGKGTPATVKERRMVYDDTQLWYRITTPIGDGWIHSGALLRGGKK